MARRRNRPSIGRQKVEIRRIEKQEARQVCFSKRRGGLFKKANELAILCGLQVVVVTFSGAGKAFAFGHPSVQAVIERFDNTGVGAVVGAGGGAAGYDNGKMEELNRRYAELRAMIDTEKARKERVDAAMAKEVADAAHPVLATLQTDVRDLGEKELVAYEAALADMRAAMAATAKMLQHALNNGHVMNARTRYQVIPPPEQFVLAGNGGARFVGQFDAGGSSSANDNGAGMNMHVQHQMMMALAMPPPGFAVASGMQMLPPPPPGFAAASGMQMLPPPPGFAAASGMQMLPPPPGYAAASGIQMLPPPPGFAAASGIQMLPPPPVFGGFLGPY